MTDDCFFHGHEPLELNDYRVCGECGHIYRTAQDLADAENAAIDRDRLYEDGIDAEAVVLYGRAVVSLNGQGHLPILSCPLCTHDW